MYVFKNSKHVRKIIPSMLENDITWTIEHTMTILWNRIALMS